MRHFILLLLVLPLAAAAQINWGKLKKQAEDAAQTVTQTVTQGDDPKNVTEKEVIAGLKEALNVAIDSAVAQVGITDGYYGDAVLKILLPPEVEDAKSTLTKIVGNERMENFIRKMNRAAEDAAKEAAPIFRDAILGITINDGMGILKGPDDAATQYLHRATYAALTNAYAPKIKTAMEKVGAQQLWGSISGPYNQAVASPFLSGEPVPTDLSIYVTQKALDGLFHVVAEREAAIRHKLDARVTDLLRKVFSLLD